MWWAIQWVPLWLPSCWRHIPDRVRSMVLGGGGALLEGSEQHSFMTTLGKSLQAGRGVEPIILSMMPPGSPPPTPEQIEQYNQMFLANQDEQALAHVALSHDQLTVSPARDENKSATGVACGG